MALARTALFVRRSVGGLFAVEDSRIATGERIFVHSGTGTDAGGYGTGPDKPVATLDYAIGLATANEATQIIVMPGHAESLVGATSLVMDVAGVQVIGLGSGRLKPQFTLTTATAATWNVTAANCSIKNVDIVSNFLDVVASMTVGTSADGLELDGIGFYDTSVILGSLIGITVAANVSDMTIRNSNYYGLELTASATECMKFAGAADRLRIENCYLKGEFSGNVIDAATAASVDVVLKDILEINMSETGGGIDLNAATTGMATQVQAYLEDHTGNEPAITGTALAMTDSVRQTNVVTASTFLCVAADS